MTGYESKRAAARDKLTMTKDEALKLALEALKKCRDRFFPLDQHETARDLDWAPVNIAIARLEEALAQPAPEGKQFQARFNIEDRVWYMKNNKPTEVIISAIEIFFVNTNQDQITYNARNVGHSVSWLDHTKLQEAWLFKSKTELLESL